MVYECSAYGQYRIANQLCQQGILVSNSDIRSIWLRLTSQETKIAQDGLILTENQLQAPEKARLHERLTEKSKHISGLLMRTKYVLCRTH